MADCATLSLPRQLPLALLAAATFHSGRSVVTSHSGRPEVAISQLTCLLMATSVRAMAESGSISAWLPLSEDPYHTRNTRTDASLGHVLSPDKIYSSVHNTGVYHAPFPKGRTHPEHSETKGAMPVEVKASRSWASPLLAWTLAVELSQWQPGALAAAATSSQKGPLALQRHQSHPECPAKGSPPSTRSPCSTPLRPAATCPSTNDPSVLNSGTSRRGTRKVLGRREPPNGKWILLLATDERSE